MGAKTLCNSCGLRYVHLFSWRGREHARGFLSSLFLSPSLAPNCSSRASQFADIFSCVGSLLLSGGRRLSKLKEKEECLPLDFGTDLCDASTIS